MCLVAICSTGLLGRLVLRRLLFTGRMIGGAGIWELEARLILCGFNLRIGVVSGRWSILVGTHERFSVN